MESIRERDTQTLYNVHIDYIQQSRHSPIQLNIASGPSNPLLGQRVGLNNNLPLLTAICEVVVSRAHEVIGPDLSDLAGTQIIIRSCIVQL